MIRNGYYEASKVLPQKTVDGTEIIETERD